MMGVGAVLHEEVVEDEATGRTVTNTTWEYKPPGIHELPQVTLTSQLQWACGLMHFLKSPDPSY